MNRFGVVVKSCNLIVFPESHFLFTGSVTFAAGCIVQPQFTVSQTDNTVMPIADRIAYSSVSTIG